jgi:hypothetical protein
MAKNESLPARRARDGKKEAARIRRKYKIDVTKHRKLLPGEIPHVEMMIVVLKLAGYSKVQIAKITGVSRVQVDEMLAAPHVQEQLVTLRERLPQAALDLLEGYMIEAVQAIVDVMRRSTDDKYILQAAGEVLDRAGMPKASRQERFQVNEDRTTFTDEGIVERLREAPVEVQEAAAQMIENLEALLSNNADRTAEGQDDAS